MPTAIRTPVENDFFSWLGLYEDYASAHGESPTDSTGLVVWSWMVDPQNPQRMLVAADESGSIVGFAQFHVQHRIVHADRIMIVDDFVTVADDPDSPAESGADEGEADSVDARLFDAILREAAESDTTVVRWIAGADDERARRVFGDTGSSAERTLYEAPVRVPVAS